MLIIAGYYSNLFVENIRTNKDVVKMRLRRTLLLFC